MKLLKYSMSVLGAAVLMTSCLGNDDRGESVLYGNLAVTEVTVPEVINPAGQTTELNVTFATTNSCQSFFDFQAFRDNDDPLKIKVAVVGSQRSGTTCTDVAGSTKQVLKFTPKTAGNYSLQFWSGKENGDSTYITKDITVPEATVGPH